ncbi:Molybdenum cofactor sulfurase (MCS) (MOS) (MoCo sulfurase) (Molybdenum cofactor sulfurtransferase) [Durusdinium trenchii]|uniref:Molybdenum cofactor sulfurase (MCS) (MOS) (MoCo sulfurase) (Molybdenum cofactor sulfurtransferase) n=2 Tax=Durusdinium trenchii TaxID=1381693 RepID=A0ABP0MWS4_9DINO
MVPMYLWLLSFLNDVVGEKSDFLAQHGDSYGYGMQNFEAFVHRELGQRLKGDVYLDYAAAGLYTNTQIDAHAEDLKEQLYGNPHSLSSSAQRSSDSVEAAREAVLEFLGVPKTSSEPEYEVVFTRSCTDSLHLIADMFPWTANRSEYKYLLQNHNSVLGIRDVARDASVEASVVESEKVDDWLDRLATEIDTDDGPLSLFAYPAEENFAGQIFPLRWSQKIASRQGRLKNWRVLMDAAKFTASHPLNLTEAQPDFVTLSFYKLFGYPTGVGALVIRSATASELKKHYWGGGTVSIAGAGRTASDDVKVFKGRIAEKFEDGTVAFLGIAALKHGFTALEKVGGMVAIEKHTSSLASELHHLLLDLKHSNGEQVIAMYSRDRGLDDGRLVQGPVVTFNILETDGTLISHIEVMADAAKVTCNLNKHCKVHCTLSASANWLPFICIPAPKRPGSI